MEVAEEVEEDMVQMEEMEINIMLEVAVDMAVEVVTLANKVTVTEQVDKVEAEEAGDTEIM